MIKKDIFRFYLKICSQIREGYIKDSSKKQAKKLMNPLIYFSKYVDPMPVCDYVVSVAEKRD